MQDNIERAQVMCRAWGIFRSRVVNDLAQALGEAKQSGIEDCIAALRKHIAQLPAKLESAVERELWIAHGTLTALLPAKAKGQ